MKYEKRLEQAKAIHARGLARVQSKDVPKGQKFQPGTTVHIADDLGRSMSHFPSGYMATVLYTHAHAYGGDDTKSYCLDVEGIGEVSWYYENQLTEIQGETT